jgi:hypothetical protein
MLDAFFGFAKIIKDYWRLAVFDFSEFRRTTGNSGVFDVII